MCTTQAKALQTQKQKFHYTQRQVHRKLDRYIRVSLQYILQEAYHRRREDIHVPDVVDKRETKKQVGEKSEEARQESQYL